MSNHQLFVGSKLKDYPLVLPGLTIGLLGSFDPPHEGHIHISKTAIKFLIYQNCGIVSPGNPIKDKTPSNINNRLLASKELWCIRLYYYGYRKKIKN